MPGSIHQMKNVFCLAMTAKTPDVLQLRDTWEAEEDLARDHQWLITNYVRGLLMTPSSNFRGEGLIKQHETFSVGTNDPKSYEDSPIIQRIKRVISETYSSDPKGHLILFMMARILIEERRKNRKSSA